MTKAKDDYAELLKDPRWRARSLEIMTAANFTCMSCGGKGVELNVHHLRYRKGAKPWEYPDQDLKCLCRPCHEKAHGRPNGIVASPRQRATDLLLNFVRIETPEEWRALLMGCAVGVLDGRVNIQQANSVVGLSTEVHKSLRQQWDMQCYVAENILIEDGRVKRIPAVIEHEEDEGEDEHEA